MAARTEAVTPAGDGPADRGGAGALGRAGVAILVLRGLGVAGLFLLQFVLARSLGPEGYGVYAYAYSLLMVLLVPTKLGLDVAGVRFVAAALEAGDRASAARFALFALARAGLAGVVLGVAWYAVGRAIGGDVLTADPATLALAAATLPALGLIRTGEGALRGARRYVLAFAPFAVAWPFLLSGAALLAGRRGDLDPATALGIQLVVSWGVALAMVVGVVVVLVRRVDRRGRPPGGVRRTWVRTAARLTVLSGLALVVGESDVVLVGWLLGEGDAGRYALAWRIASIVGGFLIAFNYAFGPVAAGLLERDDRQGIQHLLDRTMAVVAPLSIAASLGLVVLSPLLGPVFGEGYGDASAVLAVLALSQLANALGGPVALLLNMSGNERAAVAVLGIAAVGNVALNVVLLETIGLLGAAIGTAVTTVGWNVALAVVVHRRLGVVPLRPRAIVALIRTRLPGRLAQAPQR